MATIKYYWEDFAVGQVRDLGSITPTREEILAFAQQFDPQPFHLDDEAAKASVFGALSASGWHTCAMAMRLMVTNFLCETSSLAIAKRLGRDQAHEQAPRCGHDAQPLGNVQPTW